MLEPISSRSLAARNIVKCNLTEQYTLVEDHNRRHRASAPLMDGFLGGRGEVMPVLLPKPRWLIRCERYLGT